MAVLDSLKHLFTEAPPDYCFEVSEAGIAYVRPGMSGKPGWEPLEEDVLSVSPLRDNVLRPDALRARVQAIAGAASARRKRSVLILPDFCARLAVLEFDSFPSDPAEQLSLVKFRVKKSVPFDVESAVVRYIAQPPMPGGPQKHDVVVVVAALEIIARYEAPFRAAGLHPGIVTTSLLATSELNRGTGISVLVKLSGKVLSVTVQNGATVKLIRCIELPQVTPEEIGGVLFPTIAYVEDELLHRPTRVLLCGLPDEYATLWQGELQAPVEFIRSRLGTPGQYNAGAPRVPGRFWRERSGGLMRLNVNLASEPFRKDRPLVIGSFVVGGMLVVLLITLVSLAVSERNRARESREAIAKLEQSLKAVADEQAKHEAVLRKPENAEVIDRSLFLNALILRKGVSWTRIFADLENVTPHNVRLISVRPQINRENDMLLDMVVGSQSAEPVLNFLMQLEGSNLFGSTTIHNMLPPSQSDPLYRYRVSVNYAQKL